LAKPNNAKKKAKQS